MDLLHGFCAGLFKTILASSIAILLKVGGEGYGLLFSSIEDLMKSMKTFPRLSGYSRSVFKNGKQLTVSVLLTFRLGISDFVSTASRRKSLLEGTTTLSVGLGYHSKDFATLLVHFAFALMGGVHLPRVYDPAVKNLHPLPIIIQCIFACITCYSELRRRVYVILLVV